MVFPKSALPAVLSALLLPLAAAAALPSPAGPASATPVPDPFAQELQAHRSEARARLRSPEASLPLLRAFELRDRLSGLAPLVQFYGEIERSSAALPEVRALARYLLAQIERSRGRVTNARQHLDRLGLVTTFQAIGPFDNEGKRGCDTVYPPEQQLDLAMRYPGKAREVGWRRLPEEAPLGFIDLGEAFSPSAETVVYAFAAVEAKSEQKVVFHLGASGASRLWINGTRVLADDTYHPPRLDQSQVEVTLRPGQNRVLLKLCQASGPHGFLLRIAAPGGKPAEGLAISAPETLSPASAGKVVFQALPSLADHFRRRAEASPRDARAVADYAEFLMHQQGFEATERRDAVQSVKAAKLAPQDASIQLLAAQLAAEPNEKRTYLEAALAVEPTSAKAALALARHQLGHEHAHQALELLDRALASNPGYFPLALLKVETLVALGLDWQAEQLLRELGRTFEHRAAVASELAGLERRSGRPREAVERLRVVLALRHDDLNARRSLVALLSDLGETDKALKEQREINQLEPWSVASWLRTGELAAANGLPDEAREDFARARAIAPENPEIYEREGHALARLGDDGAAIGALSRALELQPQNPQIKDALEALRGGSRGFGEELARDAKRLASEIAPLPGEDSQVLSELVALKVFPSGLASRYEQLVLRVQTARGVESERTQWVTYSPDRQDLKILRARILRPDGSIVDAHAESERSLSDTSTQLYYDARARLIGFPSLAPGDVIELAWRLDDTANDNLLSDYFGDVQSIQSEVSKASFDYYLLAPKGRTIYSNEPPVKLEKREEPQPDGSTLYHWSARDVPRYTPEPGMPGVQEISAPLHVSTYKDWDAVGRYYWGLVRDQLRPGDELKRTVAELRKGLPAGDELAVVRAVYNFVVSRTRYVGLEFGIHGYKPYQVDKVLARRFGDCKDKASLMRAMLEVAGIDSRLVLLRMNRLGKLPPFPASLAIFDHAILYVPKFDLWLDGTAEQHGSRELPVQDVGATVLVIQPEGGTRLGEIPAAKVADNQTVSSYQVTLQRSGAARIEGKTTVSGLNAPSYRRTYESPATRKQQFEQGWARVFPGLSVQTLTLSDLTALDRPVELSYAMEVPRFARLEEGALSFSPFGEGQSYVESFAPLSARSHDLVLAFPWTNRSHYRIALPEGFAAGALPEPVTLQSPFGSLSVRFVGTQAALEVEAEVTLGISRVEAKQYPAFRAFLAQIDQTLGRAIKLQQSLPVAPSAQAQ